METVILTDLVVKLLSSNHVQLTQEALAHLDVILFELA